MDLRKISRFVSRSPVSFRAMGAIIIVLMVAPMFVKKRSYLQEVVLVNDEEPPVLSVNNLHRHSQSYEEYKPPVVNSVMTSSSSEIPLVRHSIEGVDAEASQGAPIIGAPFVPSPVLSTTEPKIAGKNDKFMSKDERFRFEKLRSLVSGTVSVVDKWVEPEMSGKAAEIYKGLKSVFALWNPEASKWAANASMTYRQLIHENPPVASKDPVDLKTRQDRKVTIEQCRCERTIKSFPTEGFLNGSTCSEHSFYRGPHQRVIGFSFYGNPNSKKEKERKYFKGIKDNLSLIPKFYDGWTLRLYYDLEESHSLMQDLCDVACNNPDIDLCNVRKIPASGDISKIFAMNWRFMPLLDPQVDYYVSRDLDSRLNPREAAAVSAWIDSPFAFHFMRDHPAHGIEILGSGWGVRMLQERERTFAEAAFIKAAKDPMFWAPRSAYGPDQGFLKRYIWPWGKWNALSHDSYTCVQFPRTSPFPVERKIEENNFVASVVEAKDILRQKCPLKCRPKEHQDWEYC